MGLKMQWEEFWLVDKPQWEKAVWEKMDNNTDRLRLIKEPELLGLNMVVFGMLVISADIYLFI